MRRSLGLPPKRLRFEKRVAVSRTTVSSPAVRKPLRTLNDGKAYAKQIKPFNFILSCHIRKLGYPIGINPGNFHLIAPFEPDARQWEAMPWIDQYSKEGKKYRITASGPHGSRHLARVTNYGDVLRDYEFHPEAKCADASGAPCGKQSLGMLSRRRIVIDDFDYIGKESNKIEEVEDGGVPAEAGVYTTYPDARRDHWTKTILPILRKIRLSDLEARSGLDRRTLQRIRFGRVPHARNRRLLTAIALIYVTATPRLVIRLGS